ncbi:MAG TPA: creatininase family protein [Rhodothermales bacterium]
MSTPRPYILAECTWKEVQHAQYDVAVLPWGATEAHNYHLPYSTDVYETVHIIDESARRAWERGARPIVLPAVPFGVNTGQLDIRLDLNLYPSTQLIVLRDLVDVVRRAGIRRFLLLNGHGGNDFRQMLRELQPEFPELFLCTANWFQSIPPEKYFKDLGDHAGELETSLMMHVEPSLVRPLSEAGSGSARQFRIPALRERWAWAQRAWSSVTDDTGVGDPSASTANKGAAYFEEVCEKVAALIVDLAAADPDDLYE